MDKSGKEGGFGILLIAMAISIAIASFWDKIPEIGNTAHKIFDPTAGVLLNWNVTYGMLIIVVIISFITTIVQKYATDQESLREMKKEQKILQQEMQKYKDNPQKLMELQKKSFEFIPKTFKLTSRSIAYTTIPLIVLFRWFHDYFSSAGEIKFFGFLSWFWFYLIFLLITGSVLRKILKVV